MVAKIKTLALEMNPIGIRLKLEMKKQGVSSAELARRAEVKTSFLYDVISGKSANPSTVKLARVADALGVSLAYLAGSAENPSEKYFMPANVETSEDYVTIPRLMVDISAGSGTLVSQFHKEERYYFRNEWIKTHLGVKSSELRMLYVRGDSMEPTLYHNDILLVDTTKKAPSPPGVFVLFDGFGLMPKRLEYASTNSQTLLRVISDNPQYSTYERSAEEMFIIGRVVWFAREI
jgi:phage repressor protein C with HTH and peptisase S24 domain